MVAAADRTFSVIVRVDGETINDLYSCIDQLTVEEDLERGSSFSLRLAVTTDEEGTWGPLGDGTIEPWKRVTILVAFPDHADTVMDGYITQVRPSGEQNAIVDIVGADASYVMNLEEKCRIWSTDSLGGVEPSYEEIARTIAGEYGFDPVIQETEGGGEDLPQVSQRGTDHAFLSELARRKGYEFYLRGANLHFGLPDLTGTPQRVIAYNFGDQTNCCELSIEVDGTRPTAVSMMRLNPMTGEVEAAEATTSDLDPLGQRGLADMRGYGVPDTRVMVRGQGAASLGQMEDFVQGLLRRSGWFVKATGVLDALRYGRILRSKKLVTIKGFGSTYNGNYYVKKVKHELTHRTYRISFEAHRNALEQLGTEDFAGELPDALSVPVATGAGADTDVVEVAAGGSQVAPA